MLTCTFLKNFKLLINRQIEIDLGQFNMSNKEICLFLN